MNSTLSNLERNLYNKDGFYNAYRNLDFENMNDEDAAHIVNLISHHLASLYDEGHYSKEDKKRVKAYFMSLKKANIIDEKSYKAYERQLKTLLNTPNSIDDLVQQKNSRLKTILYSAISGIGGIVGGYAMSVTHPEVYAQVYSAFNYAYTSLYHVVNELFNHIMH